MSKEYITSIASNTSKLRNCLLHKKHIHVQAYITKIKGYQDYMNEVKVCKTGKQYDSKMKKLELYVTHDQTKEDGEEKRGAEKILPMILKFFETQPGFKQLPGSPPPGDLVRRAQAILDSMET